MLTNESAINEIVKRYFQEPDKSLEDIISEYTASFTQDDADNVLSILKNIIN